MADLAKTYQLHSQAAASSTRGSMPPVPTSTIEQSPAKVQIISDEGVRQRAHNDGLEGTQMLPSFARHDNTKPTKIIVYFHGNAEDVGISYELIVKMSIAFNCSVLAVEYPGYGVYRDEPADADTLLVNA